MMEATLKSNCTAMPIHRRYTGPGNMFVVLTLFVTMAASAVEPPIRIVFLGDSLTAGYGIDSNQAYPALIAERLRKNNIAAVVQNAGLSGDTSAGALRRMGWLLRQRVDILLIALGCNDGLRGIDPQSTRENLIGIIDKARKKYPEVIIILAGMQLPPNLGDQFSSRFLHIFPEIAEEKNAGFIPFLLENVGGHRELNLPDGIHPNAAGHRIMCETVWQVLRNHVKR